MILVCGWVIIRYVQLVSVSILLYNNYNEITVGIQVTHGISWHGMAINCSVDLSYFQHITACGLEGKGTTSFSELLGRSGKCMMINVLVYIEMFIVQTKRVEQILLPSLEKTLQVQLQDVNQIV